VWADEQGVAGEAAGGRAGPRRDPQGLAVGAALRVTGRGARCGTGSPEKRSCVGGARELVPQERLPWGGARSRGRDLL